VKPWNERPFESRNLFNPAFCGVVLLRGFHGYEEEDAAGIPFSLALLILPLCLHRDTRNAISAGRLSYLSKIIQDNPSLLVGLAARCRTLLPYTLEALGLAMQYQAFKVDDGGRLKTMPRRLKSAISGTDETRECQLVARSLGKKLARIGDRVTIYTMLGIRP
jgi:hypothetical protein